MAETQPSDSAPSTGPAGQSEVIATTFLGEVPVFVFGDGRLLVGAGTGQIVQAHDGGLLCAASDGKRLVTGGDDGAVRSIAEDGSVTAIADTAGWIDAVACGPDGAIAWSSARKAFVRDGKGEQFELGLPSTGRGLAFAPKGFQLAIARYGGATLWYPRAASAPRDLEWKGSHVDVSWSPDGRFLVTAMQEPALHGWRLLDGGHMRMTGYPGKVRSISWSADGKWLATSGADAAILWPFGSKDGPMGKPPAELAVRRERVTRVACHPREAAVAVGFSDGMILFVRQADGHETVVRRPPAGGGAVSAMAWSPRGDRLAFGCEDGAAGLTELKA